MELTPKAQAVELIRASNKILVLTHQDPDGDAAGSALALRLTLKKIGKEVDVAFFGRVSPTFDFLPGFSETTDALTASNDLVMTIDTRATGEELKLGYKKFPERHQITIVVTPPKGSLVPEDVTISRAQPKYDLVVILDTASLDRLGSIAADLPDLFYETPTISIDHHSTNSYFAKVNWVDLTATSTAEMLVALIEALGRNENLLDADIATALLTGLITDTGSFQNMSTTPKSLTVAAQLVAAGARQQEIIERVFRTRSLSTLRLWGKALQHLNEETDANFIWSSVTQAEMEEVGAAEGETAGLIDQLLKTVADRDFVLLLSERGGKVHGSLRSVNRGFNVAEIARLFGGGGHEPAAAFETAGDLASGTAELISTIKKFLAEKRARATS
jgi:phosphoesterase RecJ-like protein